MESFVGDTRRLQVFLDAQGGRDRFRVLVAASGYNPMDAATSVMSASPWLHQRWWTTSTSGLCDDIAARIKDGRFEHARAERAATLRRLLAAPNEEHESRREAEA